MEERIVVIDTDAGIDDALAILISLRAHKEPSIPWRVVGITCVHGNTALDNVTVNVTRLVKLAGLEGEVPIFRGVSKPIVPDQLPRASFYHGVDGFGDTDLPKIDLKLEKEDAVHALIRLAHEYEGRLTVIPLGPLTNIALAISLDETFSSSLKELCVMGGNMWGIGNIRPCAEFNFWADPEAVHIVLASKFKTPIFLVPWETCKLEARFTLEWRTDVLGKVSSKEAELLNKIEERILLRNEQIHQGWVTCDALVPAVMLNPKVIKETQPHYCQIELHGTKTRGQMVVDHLKRCEESYDNVLAVTKVDLEKFGKMLLWGVYGVEDLPT